MLESTKIQKRQSEIRQTLSELVGKEQPTEDETRQMQELDTEYRNNETRYRAALTAEDDERRDADRKLETRDGSEWARLIDGFEVRQAVAFLDEGRQLDGATAEVVSELRKAGGYQGVPVPFAALEHRAGETTAGSIPDPVQTRPIIDRLFPDSVAAAMGASLVNIETGEVEYPVTSSSVTAGWAASETGDVAGPTQYTTSDQPLKPDHTLGIQMKLTRRTMKSAQGIEDAVRRDMRGTIQAELDKAVFQGSNASGEPQGVIAGASGYGITETAVNAAAAWSAFRAAVVRFLNANAAGSPSAVRVLIRPEVWDAMDASIFDAGSGITEYDRLVNAVGSVVQTSNALAAPTGSSPSESKSLLTTTAGGQAPIYVATWGGVDLIRDPYSDAASGALRLTGLVTMDVTVSRTAQLEVLTGVED